MQHKVYAVFTEFANMETQGQGHLDPLITATPKYLMQRVRNNINRADIVHMIKYLYVLGRSAANAHTILGFFLEGPQALTLGEIEHLFGQLNNGHIYINLD